MIVFLMEKIVFDFCCVFGSGCRRCCWVGDGVEMGGSLKVTLRVAGAGGVTCGRLGCGVTCLCLLVCLVGLVVLGCESFECFLR